MILLTPITPSNNGITARFLARKTHDALSKQESHSNYFVGLSEIAGVEKTDAWAKLDTAAVYRGGQWESVYAVKTSIGEALKFPRSVDMITH